MAIQVCQSIAHTIIVTASILYILFGSVVVAGGAAAASTPQGKALITPLYAAGTITIGAVILALGCFGCVASCSKTKKFRVCLGVFMTFDALILIATLVICAVAFKYEDSMDIASRADISVDVSGARNEAMKAIREMVEKGVYACVPEATPVNALNNKFSFKCLDIDFDFLGAAINTCYESSGPFDTRAGTVFTACYEGAEAEWPAPSPRYDLDYVAISAKGIFCKCSQSMMQLIRPYFNYVKWVAICIVIFFAAVFVACAYLCCAKKVEEPNKKKPDAEFKNLASP